MKAFLFRLGLFLCLYCSLGSAQAADYYWVGGSGNWSDLGHWATTSGGGTGHVQVPTADDDVYFDAGSFNTTTDIVTLNSDNIFFRNMTWNQAIAGVSLVGGSNVTMSVYGAFILSPGMTYNFEGSIIFNSTQNVFQDVTVHGFDIAKDILFDSQSGKWTVTTNFGIDSLLRIQDGIVSVEPNITVTSKFVEVDIDNEGSLLLDGNLVVTGNDYVHLNQPRWAIQIDANNFVLAPSSASTVTLTGDKASIFIDGNGSILFNYVDCSNPSGTASIQSEPSVQTVINRATYLSNAYTKGNVQMMELILSPSKSYAWEPGYDYNIEILTAIGTCSAPITLQSSIPGETVLFNNSSGAIGPVTGEFLNIRDINVSSGDFEVNSSLNLGNTAGWVINERIGTDLYWVGGSGDWDDASHWAMTSGGAGGACIPSANDNVFFDANSFNGTGQTVNLNIDDAFCKTMDWTGATGNSNFNSNDMNLHINGGLLMNANMNVNFTGDLYFESDLSGNIIFTSGKIFGGNAWFTGTGEWGLGDDFEIGQDIIHNAGIFETNGHTATMTDYRSESDQPRELIIANSIFRLRWIPGNGPEFIVRGPDFTIQSDASTIEFPDNGYVSLINTLSLEFNRVIFYGYGGIGNYDNLGNAVNESRFKYVDFHIWGDIGATVLYDTLKAQPGTRLLFPSNQLAKVIYLDAQGTCARPINIVSNFTGAAANVETTTTNSDITYAYVQDVHVSGGGSFTATASVDLGNNVGWVISDDGSRTLYWVGDTGSWNDPAHWSLTSGGVGGECVPTPLDDVIFDANSFSLPDQTVEGIFCYFRNMTWADIDEQAKIYWDRTFAYGSIYLSDLVIVDRWNGVSLDGSQPGNELDFKGKEVGFIELVADETGEWTVISDLRIYDGFVFLSGNFNFGGNTFNMNRFIITGSDNDLTINLDSSDIFIHGEYTYNLPLVSYRNTDFDFDPGLSNIYLTNAQTGLRLNSITIPFHNIRSTDANGTTTIVIDEFNGIMGVFNKVQFDGDAIIDGITSIDSLILAPGKSYQLKSGVAQTINNYFQILGNNCSSIELTSTQVGEKADINISVFEVVGDFIQMRDIRINNTLSSYAGIHSTDIGSSNIGWIFEDAPSETSEEQGFFGDDRVLCNNSTIELEAYPFNANATFLWNDGSTDNVLEINAPGEYYARVTFDGSCSIIDTIQILPQDQFAVVLGNDTTLCDAATLLLDVSVSGATYLWQDGSENATFNVSTPGDYSVDVNLGGCSISDTITVGYVSFADINLGADQTICENDEISFDVTVPGGSYRWQDNSTMPTFSTDMAGTYYVDVTTDNCTATDTIIVSVTPLANVSLGNDTTICEGTALDIDAVVLADSYSWSNGSVDPTTSLGIGVQYLDVTLDGCTASDTIIIDSKPFPEIELGPDTVLCAGEILPIDLTGTGDDYLWNDGSDQAVYSITGSGNYDVIVGLDGCIAYDTLVVNYNEFPDVDLGNDTTVCEGVELLYELPSQNLTNALWSEGTMNGPLQASVSGQYYLDAYNGRCLSSDTVNLEFNQRPIFDLGEDMTQCLGQPLEVDASVSGASYIWSDGSAQAMNSFTTEGDHWVDVTLDGCTVRDTVQLRYIQIPDASLGRDTVLCEGDFLFFDFSNLNLMFEWSDTSTDPTNTLGATGTYWLEVTDRDCTSRDSITLLYKPSPSVDLGRDTMLCTGDVITLSISVAPDEEVTWSDNSLGDMLIIENSGSYTVEVDKNGCIANDEIIVTFNDPPSFDLGQDTLICEQQPLVLRPGISGATYRWQDGSAEASFTVDRPGTYEVEVTKGGCSSNDDITVDTRVCTFYRAYLPEAFSPNGDGLNDTYQPGFPDGLEIISYSMHVYDRWGNQIFVSEDPNQGWDGTFNQTSLNRGTYVYTISVEYIDDRGPGSKLQRGEVLLMK